MNQKSAVWAEHGVKRITHKLAGSGKAAGEPKGFPPPTKTDSHALEARKGEHKAVRLSQVGRLSLQERKVGGG